MRRGDPWNSDENFKYIADPIPQGKAQAQRKAE